MSQPQQPQQPKAAPTTTNTIDNSLEEILDATWAYGVDWTEHKLQKNNDNEISVYAAKLKSEMKEKLRAAINKTIMEGVLECLPSRKRTDNEHEPTRQYLQGYNQALDDVRQQITKKYGRADNE